MIKLINKDFGNRLHGMSFVLWFVAVCTKMPVWYGILSAIVLTYFIFFGVKRFTEEYRKTI